MGCSLISPEPRRRVGALKGTICASQLQQRRSISRASVTCGATRSACRDRHGLKARGGGGAWAVRPTLAPEPAARSFAIKERCVGKLWQSSLKPPNAGSERFLTAPRSTHARPASTRAA